MKRINYLIVAMLIAFTMVGCQVDLSDYLTKEEADAKYATIAYVDGKVAELETKINDIDAKFADYYTKGEVDGKLEGYATKESLEALSDISGAVKKYLETVNWNDYIEDGYTNDEIVEKINAIKEITDKLGDVETLLDDITNLKSSVTSLKSTVEELNDKVTNLENTPTTPSGNGGDGYCGLSTSEVEKIKEILQKYVNGKLEASILNLTGYALETDLANYVKTTTLNDYYPKADLDTILDGDTSNNENFKTDLAKIVGRIATVEALLTVDGVLGKKLTDLEAKVNGKLDSTVFNTFKGNYESLASMITSLNLTNYLTFTDLGYETKDKVENVAEKLADLTSRVETLETILEIENNTSKIINELKLAVKGVDGNKNLVAELNNALNELKGTVENNSNKLTRLIGDDYTDIETITNRVAELETLLNGYSDFKKNTIESLAKIEETLENKADSFDKDDIVSLIKDSFIEKAKETTFATSDQLNELTTKVNSKADTTEMNNAKEYIKEINSKYASLVSDRTSFEICPNMYEKIDNIPPTYLYYPYIKFTYADNKTEYMTITEDKYYQGYSDNLLFNFIIESIDNYVINFVDEIPDYSLLKKYN